MSDKEHGLKDYIESKFAKVSSEQLTKREHFAFEIYKIYRAAEIQGRRTEMPTSDMINDALEEADGVIKALNEEKEVKKSIPAMPCSSCKKPRGDKEGLLITPCPHCGEDIPF